MNRNAGSTLDWLVIYENTPDFDTQEERFLHQPYKNTVASVLIAYVPNQVVIYCEEFSHQM